MEITPVAKIRTDFPAKFGLPRQSMLVSSLPGKIIFEKNYRRSEMLRGLEGFSHIWVLWGFSEHEQGKWSPTVKPPRLGGKVRMGVWATRSPFRPNQIGLSCLKIEEIIWESEDGPMILVSGIDMMDGTPIYDIKPYLPYADAHPEARQGFTSEVKNYELEVIFPEEYLEKLPEEKRRGALDLLRQDPRPPYHNHPEQVYKIAYAGWDIHFTVKEKKLNVTGVIEYKK